MGYFKNILLMTTIISIAVFTPVICTASDNLSVKLKIGNTTAYVNEVDSELEVAPFIDPNSNRTLVPLRFIAETFGADVKYYEVNHTTNLADANGAKREVVDKDQNIDLTIKEGTESGVKYPITWFLRIGRSDAWNSNDIKKEDAFFGNPPSGHLAGISYASSLTKFQKDMEQAPLIVNNKTMVPLRFIAEHILNLNVQWDDKTQSIILTR
jgi:hypothetical protein